MVEVWPTSSGGCPLVFRSHRPLHDIEFSYTLWYILLELDPKSSDNNIKLAYHDGPNVCAFRPRLQVRESFTSDQAEVDGRVKETARKISSEYSHIPVANIVEHVMQLIGHILAKLIETEAMKPLLPSTGSLTYWSTNKYM